MGLKDTSIAEIWERSTAGKQFVSETFLLYPPISVVHGKSHCLWRKNRKKRREIGLLRDYSKILIISNLRIFYSTILGVFGYSSPRNAKYDFTDAAKHISISALDSIPMTSHIQPRFCNRFKIVNRPDAHRGFSLVEMLVVMGIMSILTTLAVASFSGLQGSKFGHSVTALSDYMTQAQTVARASNSYVWVMFTQSAADPTKVEVIAVQGNNGLQGDLASNQVTPAARPLVLDGTYLSMAGGTHGQTPDGNAATDIPSATSSTGILPSPYVVSVGGVSQSFSYIIGISPSGQSFVQSTTLPHWIRIVLTPTSNPNWNNYGIVYVAGLTSEVSTFRP